MKKKLIIGLVLFSFCTFALEGAATSTPSSRPKKLQGTDVSKKIVTITETNTKIIYPIFEQVHQMLVDLCEALERSKKLKIEDAVSMLAIILNALIDYQTDAELSPEIFHIAQQYNLTQPPNKNFYLIANNKKIPEFLNECIKLIIYKSATGFFWYYLISELEQQKQIIIEDATPPQKNEYQN